jgi:DNA-binding response OmpR family regulator
VLCGNYKPLINQRLIRGLRCPEQNRNRIVSKSAIAEHLSGDMADMLDDFNFIYAHIKNLKSKLAAAGMPNSIKTIYGTGYKWNIDE